MPLSPEFRFFPVLPLLLLACANAPAQSAAPATTGAPLVATAPLTIAPATIVAPPKDEIGTVRDEATSLRAAVETMRRAAGRFDLSVNGERIPNAAIERAFVYIYGRTYIDRKIRDFLVADELEFRRKSDLPVENLEVGSAEILAEIDKMKEQLAAQMPGMNTEAILRQGGLDPATLAEEQASLLLFDRVFIPDDPAKWPEATKQALASQGGEAFVKQIVDQLTTAREKNPNEPIPAFYRTLFRQWITKALREVSRVKTASLGLPPETILTVNDRPLPTADAYRAVAPVVTALERERVMRWISLGTAVRQELTKKGVYLSEEDFQKEFDAHEAPYKASPLNIEVVATAFKKFPSYDLYREYFRMRKSYERMIEKEITDEALRAHAQRVQDFLGDGKVDAQVILCTALNYDDFMWKGPDAFDKAREAAAEVVQKLKAGESFDAMIDRFSQFFEPPTPATPQQQNQPRPNRGRFGLQNKNTLKTLLGETEFDELLRGYSIGEILFHETKPGEAIGPIRGPMGYYVARVVSRMPGNRPVDLAVENSRNLVREDYLARRFLEWSNEVVGRSKIEVQ